MLTVAQVAARSGFAASALRFYEREGLIRADRTAGKQRRYRRDVLRRLAFIRAARNVGLSLDEVRAELAQLPDERTPTTGGLAPDQQGLAGPAEREDHRDRGAAGSAGLLHRLRMPVAEGLRAVQPGGRVGRQRDPPGAVLLPRLLREPRDIR